MKGITFDFNNMFSDNIGVENGLTHGQLKRLEALFLKAHRHLSSILNDGGKRVSLGLEWAALPAQSERLINSIQAMGDQIARKYKNVLFLGIGGSYLGLKAAQDALCPPYYNEFDALRKGRPKIYFEGNNLDPDTLHVLLHNLDPKQTYVVVISKSGETTETKAAFEIVEKWLEKGCGSLYGRHITAVTDPESGALRRKISLMNSRDKLSYRSLDLQKGVGGRFSELNMGLLHLAVSGVRIKEVLEGASWMSAKLKAAGVWKNPAYMYAALHYLMDKHKGKPIAVLMPFCESLKSTADWYVQLLAESLGKKYERKIIVQDGMEKWLPEHSRAVFAGRTPVSSRGTNDLHSIQQNNIEGKKDKVATFIKVNEFRNDLRLPAGKDFLAGKSYSQLMSVALEATQWAMVRAGRPNCTIILPELNPFYWGALLFFFELATAFEGELLNINAFDQPGVEGYKNYMYYKLCKPGLSPLVSREIRQHPLIKKKKYIL